MPKWDNGITFLVVATLALFLAFDFVRTAPSPMLYKRNPDEKYEAGNVPHTLFLPLLGLYFPSILVFINRSGARFLNGDPLDGARGELRAGGQAQ